MSHQPLGGGGRAKRELGLCTNTRNEPLFFFFPQMCRTLASHIISSLDLMLCVNQIYVEEDISVHDMIHFGIIVEAEFYYTN